MITRNNLKEVLDNLSQSDIDHCYLNTESDILCLSVSIFNTGFISQLDTIEPDQIEEEESQGNLVLDFEQLLELFKESGSTNPYLLELI